MSSGFVTESELEERKRVRQEEWERVRKPEDPISAPEEPVDNRSLFERLEEQRVKKQEEWDEEHKFKNQFRGLDDDEVDFLDKIDDVRTENERQRYLDEKRELEEYQKSQQLLRERELEARLENERKTNIGLKRTVTNHNAKNKQINLLAGAVKRKSDKKDCSDKRVKRDQSTDEEDTSNNISKDQLSSAAVVGGLLGLADYGSDSDTE